MEKQDAMEMLTRLFPECSGNIYIGNVFPNAFNFDFGSKNVLEGKRPCTLMVTCTIGEDGSESYYVFNFNGISFSDIEEYNTVGMGPFNTAGVRGLFDAFRQHLLRRRLDSL